MYDEILLKRFIRENARTMALYDFYEKVNDWIDRQSDEPTAARLLILHSKEVMHKATDYADANAKRYADMLPCELHPEIAEELFYHMSKAGMTEEFRKTYFGFLSAPDMAALSQKYGTSILHLMQQWLQQADIFQENFLPLIGNDTYLNVIHELIELSAPIDNLFPKEKCSELAAQTHMDTDTAQEIIYTALSLISTGQYFLDENERSDNNGLLDIKARAFEYFLTQVHLFHLHQMLREMFSHTLLRFYEDEQGKYISTWEDAYLYGLCRHYDDKQLWYEAQIYEGFKGKSTECDDYISAHLEGFIDRHPWKDSPLPLLREGYLHLVQLYRYLDADTTWEQAAAKASALGFLTLTPQEITCAIAQAQALEAPTEEYSDFQRCLKAIRRYDGSTDSIHDVILVGFDVFGFLSGWYKECYTP